MDRRYNSAILPDFGRKIEKKRVIGVIIALLVLLLLAVFFLFPFFVMFCLSILPNNEINLQVLFSPSGTINIGTYLTVLQPGGNYLRYLGNTVFVSLLSAVGVTLASSICAYGFAKLEFKGREAMFALVLSTMMIPPVISIIPLYTIYAKLGWINTLYPMWVPALFGGGATNIFLMRQFMRGIPDDMLKAAKLDGANSFVIYCTIMIRLCIPIMLYVAVISFMGTWNDFMTPMTFLENGSKSMTLSLGIYYDYGPASTKLANVAMAAGVIMTLPCGVLFLVFQKFLIDGVAVTGMKD